MKILIIGSGGREHAIGKKIKNQQPQAELFFMPGNGGTLQLGKNIPELSNEECLQFAMNKNIDLTIVGPEQPLVEGIVNLFHENNLKIFGPDQRSAKLEGSKAFAKEFMQKYGIKTARHKTFEHFVDAKEYIKEAPYPLVIKADGLAAGKGVVICQDHEEALSCIRSMMLDKNFGHAGETVVIEEFLQGFEASILSIYNRKKIYPMLSAQDHKKIGEGETGLNTGGMGVIVPNPNFTTEHYQDFHDHILQPTLEGLQEEGLFFSGVIFFGLMVSENGCYLLEYNMRFGDPETQTVLPLMNNDFLECILHSIDGKEVNLEWEKEISMCVVIASGGYPMQYDKGYEIHGLENLKPQDYDIAGAEFKDPIYYTSGGRVLNILSQEKTIEKTRTSVYEKVDKVRFEYNYYRKDI